MIEEYGRALFLFKQCSLQSKRQLKLSLYWAKNTPYHRFLCLFANAKTLNVSLGKAPTVRVLSVLMCKHTCCKTHFCVVVYVTCCCRISDLQPRSQVSSARPLERKEKRGCLTHNTLSNVRVIKDTVSRKKT